jgi:YegS/Rv2252/BmrU family lipid kinase
LNRLAADSVFKPTAAAGDARRLAAEAVKEGHDTVVAAGGDGTLNEVLNGLGDVPGGFERTRLGIIPLGTVNVFARELGIPPKPSTAWEIIRSGRETQVDLPWVEQTGGGRVTRHYFTQLAGAGLDARAIELVSWKTKKKVGPLAYVMAGLRALCEAPAELRVRAQDMWSSCALVLIGNGRLYGGSFRVFPEADLRDAALEVCVFPKVHWWILLRCGLPLLLSGRVPSAVVRRFRGSDVVVQGVGRVPIEVDGELVGHLPARFGLNPLGLRVLVPA